MKLYEVPRNTKIRYVYENQEYILDFKHIDGIFSYCLYGDKVIHLPATEEVEIVEETNTEG